MRALLFVLMIALLPLRGWMGDVMAMEMGAVRASDTPLRHDGPHSRAHTAPMAPDLAPVLHDHASHQDHAMAAPQPGADFRAGGTMPGDCAGSDACQICHTVALAPLQLLLPPAPIASMRPALQPARFASAESGVAIKPPIS